MHPRRTTFFKPLIPCSLLLGHLFTLFLLSPARLPAATSAQILEMQFDASVAGMGYTGLAWPGNSSAIWRNPASLAALAFKSTELRASLRKDFDDVYFGSITGVCSLNQQSRLFAGLVTFYGGTLDLADESYNPIAQQDILIGLGYARNLENYIGWKYPLKAGLTAKYWSSTLAGEFTAKALAGDLGLYLGGPIENLYLALVIQNMGMPITYEVEAEPLPTTLAGGLSWSTPVFPDLTVLLATDVRQPRERDLIIQSGLEIAYLETLYLRAGYRFLHDSDSFSLGLGFSLSAFQLDYAFLENRFAAKHMFTFGFRWVKSGAFHKASLNCPFVEQGIALCRHGRFKEAKALWTQARDNIWARHFLRLYPQLVEDWIQKQNRLAGKLAEKGDFSKAVEIWKKNLDLNSQDIPSQRGLARQQRLAAQYLQQARTAFVQKEWTTAVVMVEEALAIKPEDEAAAGFKSFLQTQIKRKEETEKLITRSVRKITSLAQAGKPMQAMRQLAAALEAVPAHALLLKTREEIPAWAHQKALGLKAQGKYRQALEIWESILKTVPDCKNIKNMYHTTRKYYLEQIQQLDRRAMQAYRETNYLAAIKLWTKRHQLSPEKEVRNWLAQAYEAHGIIKYRQGDPAQAIVYWRAAKEYNPGLKNIIKNIRRAKKKVEFLKKLFEEDKT